VHIELSTAVVELVEVNTKVTNASLTQNQCLQCIMPPLTHVDIPVPRDVNATEQNNDGMIKLGDIRPLPNRTECVNFYEKDLIDDNSSFCSHILLAIDLHCHVFPFENLC